MVNSKQLKNIKINAANVFKNHRCCNPRTEYTRSSTTNFNNEEFLEIIRKILKEETENHEEKVGEVIKAQLENTNNRLDRILLEVVDITKFWNICKNNLMKD